MLITKGSKPNCVGFFRVVKDFEAKIQKIIRTTKLKLGGNYEKPKTKN
jgi:hypothetical protein